MNVKVNDIIRVNQIVIGFKPANLLKSFAMQRIRAWSRTIGASLSAIAVIVACTIISKARELSIISSMNYYIIALRSIYPITARIVYRTILHINISAVVPWANDGAVCIIKNTIPYLSGQERVIRDIDRLPPHIIVEKATLYLYGMDSVLVIASYLSAPTSKFNTLNKYINIGQLQESVNAIAKKCKASVRNALVSFRRRGIYL